FNPCMPGLGQGFHNAIKVHRIIGIVERLRPFGHELKAEWLRNSNHLTFNPDISGKPAASRP
ncbi:MAG TPA: hypothetical protein VMW09_03870, partial [Desulfatiglandales bacterium]|nr:hypothetical protein [Desulfatiglandales bacterium]HUV59231.1 hypothetical protein [Desulfatiglandales bacterium]